MLFCLWKWERRYGSEGFDRLSGIEIRGIRIEANSRRGEGGSDEAGEVVLVGHPERVAEAVEVGEQLVAADDGQVAARAVGAQEEVAVEESLP